MDTNLCRIEKERQALLNENEDLHETVEQLTKAKVWDLLTVVINSDEVTSTFCISRLLQTSNSINWRLILLILILKYRWHCMII